MTHLECRFKVGDTVKVVSSLERFPSNIGLTFVVNAIAVMSDLPQGDYYLYDDSDKLGIRASCCELVSFAKQAHVVGTVFYHHDANEAKEYIGREVNALTTTDFSLGKAWKTGKLLWVADKSRSYSFAVVFENGQYTDFCACIILTQNSFPKTKLKVSSGLIKALELSIQQWQIMYDTGKSKREVYEFLSGKIEVYEFFSSKHDPNACFLCASNNFTCNPCISWHESIEYPISGGCTNKGSVYKNYSRNPNKKSAKLKVLKHLKNELTRLTKGLE